MATVAAVRFLGATSSRRCCLPVAAALSRNPIPAAVPRWFSARPASTFYSEKHEWVRVDGGVGTVGISQYAQDSLGDVVYAQLPEVDDAVTAGDDCGALESVKAATEIYSPVSGTVTAKNEEVENKPSLINSSPEGDGWLFKVKMEKEEAELSKLMDEAAYKEFLKSVEKDD